jgi:predicted nucleotidyltransferase
MTAINKDEIISISRIRPAFVSNIYLYGSRVYGTATEQSDYDILMTGSNSVETQEIFSSTPTGNYNVHICVPNKFEDDLRKHDIHALECIFAPDFARIQIKKDYASTFVINKDKLKCKLLSQSSEAWHKGQRRILDADIYRGAKSIYHSLRILMFGIQMAKSGKITDFKESNYLYNGIVESDQYKWNYYKDNYLPLRRKLEQEFKDI